MKTFSKTLDGPETEPQQITENEVTTIPFQKKLVAISKGS